MSELLSCYMLFIGTYIRTETKKKDLVECPRIFNIHLINKTAVAPNKEIPINKLMNGVYVRNVKKLNIFPFIIFILRCIFAHEVSTEMVSCFWGRNVMNKVCILSIKVGSTYRIDDTNSLRVEMAKDEKE